MREARVHPVQSVRRFGRTLAALLIPLLRQLLAQPDSFGAAVMSSIGNVLLAGLILAYAVAEGRSVRYRLQRGEYHQRSGVLLQRELQLFRRAPEGVCAHQSLLLRLLGVWRVKLISPCKSAYSAELCMSGTQARRIFRLFGAHACALPGAAPAPRHAVIAAMAQSNAAAGLLLAIPFVRQTGSLLGAEAEALLLEQFDPRLRLLALGLPPVTAALAGLLLLGWAVAFGAQLLKTLPFDAYSGSRSLIAENGVLPHQGRALRIERVHLLLVRQTLLMRMSGIYTLYAQLPGANRKRARSEAPLLAAANEVQLSQWLRAQWPYRADGQWFRPVPRARIRYSYTELTALPICAALRILTRELHFSDALSLIPAAFGVFFIWRLLVHQAEFREAGIRIGAGGLAVHYARRLSVMTAFLPRTHIRAVERHQSVFQRGGKYCSIRIYTDGIPRPLTVRYLSVADYTEISRCLTQPF